MHRLGGLLVIVAAMLAAPASASAATVFGADMSQEPGFATSIYTVTTVIDPGGAANTGAPISGILTSVRLKTEGAAGSGVIQILTQTSHPNVNDYVFANVAPEIPITVTAGPSPGHVTEVLTRRPIVAGQKLAVDLDDGTSTILDAYHDASAGCAFAGSNPVGSPTTYSFGGCNENLPLISGTIEADADGDGFGDDTQDQCPTNASTQAPCPTTTPVVAPPPHKKKCKKKHRSADAVVAKKCKKKHH
jgi:hypothetical protein